MSWEPQSHSPCSPDHNLCRLGRGRDIHSGDRSPEVIYPGLTLTLFPLSAYIDHHCCPAINRTESVGCPNRSSLSGSRMLGVPVKWAFSQKGLGSKSVEFGRGSLPAPVACERWRRVRRLTQRSRFESSLRSRWFRRMP